MKIQDVKRHLENAKKTKKNLEGSEMEKISLSRKNLIGYCKTTISLCNVIIKFYKLIRKNETNNR